ncbi:MAG TPA: chemotaxis protein CheD [Opitutus sp.]|nr:chemotaxis protein CheD [Opitutus sp.]
MGAPTIASIFAQRVVIGVGDMAVSNNSLVTLSTYALGSCIGVVAYDPLVKVGGILHLMLPDSSISPEKAAGQPAMFADTGLPLFFRSLLGLKADRSRLRVFVTGGACVLTSHDNFKIGERNTKATLEFLAANGYRIRQQVTGGTTNRTVHLEIGNGNMTLKTPQANEGISLAA